MSLLKFLKIAASLPTSKHSGGRHATKGARHSPEEHLAGAAGAEDVMT